MPLWHFHLLLLLCLHGQHQAWAQRPDFVATIEPKAETTWGTWGSDEWCPPGQFAYGFRAKVLGMQGGGDDAGVSAIKLHCKSGDGTQWGPGITSRQINFGSWTYSRNCDCNRFLSAVSMRSEPGQGSGDDTAVNNFNFKCEDGNWMYGSGTPWGNWHDASCPSGTVICGIKTKVEEDQTIYDDTALNQVKFHCCRAPTSRGLAYHICPISVQQPNPSEWIPTFYFDSKQACYPYDWKPNINHSGMCKQLASLSSSTPIYYEVHQCNTNKILSITYHLYFGGSLGCLAHVTNDDWERVTLNFKQCDRKYCIDSVAYYQLDGYYTRAYDYEDERKSVNVYVGKLTNAFYHNTCCSNCQSSCNIFLGQCNYFNDYRDPGHVWKPATLQPFPANEATMVTNRLRCDRNSCGSKGCDARNWELYA